MLPKLSGMIGRDAYKTGDVSQGLLSAGQALGLTKVIATIAKIFAQLEAEAQTALNRLTQAQTPKGATQ